MHGKHDHTFPDLQPYHSQQKLLKRFLDPKLKAQGVRQLIPAPICCSQFRIGHAAIPRSQQWKPPRSPCFTPTRFASYLYYMFTLGWLRLCSRASAFWVPGWQNSIHLNTTSLMAEGKEKWQVRQGLLELQLKYSLCHLGSHFHWPKEVFQPFQTSVGERWQREF